MAFGGAPFGVRSFAQLSGSDLAVLMSAFNFCDPFDHILPPPDSTISALDRQHLWGMYTGIAIGPPAVIEAPADAFTGGWLHRQEREWLRRLGQPPEIVAQVRQLVPEVEAIFETSEQVVSVSRVTRDATEAEESTFLDTLEALATDLEVEHRRLAQDLRDVVARLRDEEMQAVFLMTVMLLA